jgi:hypothetical protein
METFSPPEPIGKGPELPPQTADSSDFEQEVAQLRAAEVDAQYKVSDAERMATENKMYGRTNFEPGLLISGSLPSLGILDGLQKAGARHGLHKANRAAEKHYKKREDDYVDLATQIDLYGDDAAKGKRRY